MIVVDSLAKTCGSCPAQWNGRTRDGRHVYVRYRWGWLQVGIGDTREEAIDTETIGVRLGGQYDGVLSLDGLKAATQGCVSWPTETGESEL